MAFTEKRLAGPIQVNTGQTSTLYTCNTSVTTSTMVKQIIVCNLGATNANFNINLVPQGNTVATNNRIFSNTLISTNETLILDVSQVMTSGDFLSFTAAGANVSVTISGVENQGGMVLAGLADNSVTTTKIANSNITSAKLGPNAFLANPSVGAIVTMEIWS